MTEFNINSYKFFPFYLKNTPKRMRNEWTIILCVSISLSLISGLSYFFESTQKYTFENSFWLFSDFDIIHHELFSDFGAPIPSINYDYYFDYTDKEIRELLNSTELKIESYAPYSIFGIEQGVMTIDDFDSVVISSTESVYDYHRQLNASSIKMGIFNNDFYNSPRFDMYFEIMEGRFPTTENEILVDLNYAAKYGYNINETRNITLVIGNMFNSDPPVSDYHTYQIANMTIVGTYLCTQEWFRIGAQRYTYSYTYENYLNNQTYVYPEELERNMVFMYGDFENLTNHPIQNLYNEISQIQQYAAYLESGIISSGYVLFYDRSQIEYENLYYSRNYITQNSRNLSLYMPFEVGFVNKISYQLRLTHEEIRNSFLVIQILNIPIIVFSLLVSQNINDSRGKKANEELILLKLRGVSVRQIQLQLLMGGLINGIICTIFGSLMGNATFYLYHRMLGELFFENNIIFLSPLFTWGNLWYTLFLGILINAFTIIPKMVKIGKIEFVDASESLQQVEQLSLNYDEKVLFEGVKGPQSVEDQIIHEYVSHFKKFEKEKNTLKTLDQKNAVKALKTGKLSEIKQRFQNSKWFHRKEQEISHESQKSQGSQEPQKIQKYRFWKRKQSEYTYEGMFEIEKYSVKPLTYFLIFIGLIPLVIYAYVYFSYRFEVSDVIIDNRELMVENIYYVHFFSLFFIGFFVSGLIRLLIIERPSRFARFAKFLASIFITKLDHLVSLELIRKKKWSKIIIYLSIFFSMLTIVNFSFNSQYRYEIFHDDFQSGADFNLFLDQPGFHNQTEFEKFETQLINLQTDDQTPIINDLTQVFHQNNSWAKYDQLNTEQIGNARINSFLIDTEAYLEIISTDDRPFIYPDYPNQIRQISPVLENDVSTTVNVIVTSAFLAFTSKEIGDVFEFTITVYDSTMGIYTNLTITAEIQDTLDVVPGIYNTNPDRYLGILMDIGSLHMPNHQFVDSNIIELFDINKELEWTPEYLIENYSPLIFQYTDHFRYDSFDPTWNDINTAQYSLTIGSSGFYGLINLDFVLIGLLLAIELSLTIVIMNRENFYYNELLLVRGVGRRRITSLNLLETLIAFIVSGLIGAIIGIVFAFFICGVNLQYLIASTPGNLTNLAFFPIYGNVATILFSYGVVFLIVMLVVYMNHRVQGKIHEEYINKEAI
ncbi:MAG: hypothetical protein ACTSYI_08080 [Promethearchaeota archaeon]